jgi:outer membrane receptor protein involved in Fe transport
MRKIFILVAALLSFTITQAQFTGGGGSRMGGANTNMGHFYGKIVDSKTNKGVPGVSVQLVGNKFDTVTKQMKQATLKTMITQENGDFSLENLPIFGSFKLNLSAIGYKSVQQTISFNIKMPQGGGGGNGEGMQQMLGQIDKDLGNIKLETAEGDLGNVTVTSTAKQQLELGIDKKIFNVDKNLVSTGQTATEIMKNIPSVNVDIDGNVTMRNAAPTIFVDGRPTTMTLDQIPSDIIDKIEIITNPSAKYDASGGGAGILNIILKKNKKVGYNGGLRAGVDSRGKINAGGDINLRQNKFNFFLGGSYNQRKSIANSQINQYTYETPPVLTYTTSDNTSDGAFGFVRGGFDYLIDNRNTLSLTANYNKGNFESEVLQHTDSTGIPKPTYSNGKTNSNNTFKNNGIQASYKHNFAKAGHALSADFNYNSSDNNSASNNGTFTYDANTNVMKYFPLLQETYTNGYNKFYTTQIDYENQLTDDSKLELGARAAVRDFKNLTAQYKFDTAAKDYLLVPNISSSYKFNDQVYAAYGTYSFKVKKWSYLLGLRVESSNYTGNLITAKGTDSANFKVSYPLSFFPSAFITYKLNAKEDFQLNYSRRVNRPNFFQLMPFANYLNYPYASIGNPALTPEFTNSFEVSYNNAYKKGSNFLATLYLKYTTDLITNYSFKGPDGLKPGDSIWYNTYVNANKAYAYGLELTEKLPVTKWWDLNLNVNLFYSQIDASVQGQSIPNSQVSWFAKINNNFKVAKGWNVQFSGDYQSKSVLPQGSSNGGGGGRGGGMGGGGFGGGVQTTAQGYVLPRFGFDMAIRKDWTWKNGQSGSVTLSMNDIFRTQLSKTHSEQPGAFIQDVERRRDPQILRLNFTYRFGKFDANLFKRKNSKADQSGGADMGG